MDTTNLRGAARFNTIRDRILAVIARSGPVEVGMEFFNDVQHTASSTESVWLHGVVHLALAGVGLHAVYIAPATLKKWMTGRGNKVEKDEMVTAIAKQYGGRLADHNASEAYGLACLALERARFAAGEPSIRGLRFNDYEKGAMMKWKRAFQ